MMDGDIQHRVRATALEEEAITALGTHQVRFQVNNALGDTRTLELPVEVYAADAYKIDRARYGKNFIKLRYGIFCVHSNDRSFRG